MATDLKERAPGSDEDSRIPGQYARHLNPGGKAGNKAGGKAEDKSGNVAGGLSRPGGTDKTGASASAENFKQAVGDNAKKAALNALGPEASAVAGGFEKLKQTFAGSKKRKQTSMIGLVAIVVIGGMIMAFVALLPDELIALMSSLEHHFFSKVEYDMDKEVQKEMSRYIQKRIAKRLSADCKDSAELSKCASAKDRNGGNDTPPEEDPLEGKNAEFDKLDEFDFADKLAEKNIKLTWEGGKIFMEDGDIPGSKTDVTELMDKEGANIFEDPALVNNGLAESLTTKVTALAPAFNAWLHLKFTETIQKLVGGKFCFADCDPGNEAKDREKLTPDELDKAAEAVDLSTADATEKAVADSFTCITDVTCDPTDTHPQTGDGYTDPEEGMPESTYDSTVSADVAAVPAEDVGALAADEAGLEKLTAAGDNAMADAMAEELAGTSAEDVSTKLSSTLLEKFSAVLWIQTIGQVISFFGSANVKLADMNYRIHDVMVLRQFMVLASAADEMKSGQNHPEIRMLGSITGMLHAGGTTAESAPLVASSVDPKHHSNITNKDVRNDLVKHHTAFNDNSSAVSKLSDILNKVPGFQILVKVANLVNKLISLPLGPLNALISAVFGVTGMDKLIGIIVGPIIKMVTDYLFPVPNLAKLDGQTAGTLAAEGTDDASSKTGEAIGGKALTPTESAQLANAQENIDYQQFRHQTFYARMFDINSPYSFVNKMALAIPASNFGELARSSFASLLANPLSKIAGVMGTVLRSPQAFAAAPAEPDPTGIVSYGLPVNDPVFTADPEDYWQSHDCAAQSAADYPDWNSKTHLDPTTGQTVHDTTNGCLLIQRAALAGGAIAGFQ